MGWPNDQKAGDRAKSCMERQYNVMSELFINLHNNVFSHVTLARFYQMFHKVITNENKHNLGLEYFCFFEKDSNVSASNTQFVNSIILSVF